METTFENAKVGDRVYSPLFVGKGETNGEIIKILNALTAYFSIEVMPDNAKKDEFLYVFTVTGAYFSDSNQVLFWSRPEFEVPVRRGRMVKKIMWIGYDTKMRTNYGDDKIHWLPSTSLYVEKNDAAEACPEYKVIPIEIEVEE